MKGTYDVKVDGEIVATGMRDIIAWMLVRGLMQTLKDPIDSIEIVKSDYGRKCHDQR